MFCSRMKAELACTSTTEVRECTEDLENVKFLPVYRKLPVSLEDPVLYVLGWNFYGSKDGLNFPQLWRTGRQLNCSKVHRRDGFTLCRFLGENLMFMHDNARSHTAHVVKEYLQEAGIQTLDPPAMSPDLNPIEHLWDELKRWVRARNPPPVNHRELKQELSDEWEEIPQETVKSLIVSMRNRMQADIQARV